MTTDSLRKKLRDERRSLSVVEQQRYAENIIQRVLHSSAYKDSRHIALYLPSDGEVDLSGLIKQLHNDGKHCYLPVILSKENASIAFAPFDEETVFQKNCFGISEPVFLKEQLKSAKQLDLILTPLVGFDEQGNRIGMGGGYYDRALQHLNEASSKTRYTIKPMVYGIAYERQKIEQLQPQSWDVKLNAIVTEERLTLF
ncbi:MAG: 5-formyltetrahydrofolate cyclo-ligase [Gammaproteobacteria bacterium]|nr:5-formyltetrahydrofolate cyclo-ligase [Gammaproteobacteria bacterium]